MRVYAVLDLKAGQVVHAVAGKRDRYQPIRSALVQSSEPRDVAHALRHRWGIQDAYVADLDAIGGKTPDLESIQSIAATGMRLILDAGVGEPQQAESLLEWLPNGESLQGLVVALESTSQPEHWPELVEKIGHLQAVFSLDLRAGQPLTRNDQLAEQNPLDIASRAWHAGFRRLIALDLQSVGTGQGPSTLGLCRDLSQHHAWSELISGGGVRDAADVRAFAAAGCHSVLVASALHRALGWG